MLNPAQLRASIVEAQADIEKHSQIQRDLEAQLAELAGRIDKRRTYIVAAEALLKDLEPTSGPVPEAGGDDMAMYSLAEAAAIGDLPRSGYGAISRAVNALLESEPDGYSVRDLVRALEALDFHLVGQDHELPVRSALKNLRNQGKIVYRPETGRYQAKPKEPSGVQGMSPLVRRIMAAANGETQPPYGPGIPGYVASSDDPQGAAK